MAAFTGLACHNIYIDVNVHLRAHPAPLLVNSFTKQEPEAGRVYVQPAGWISSDMTLLGLTLESALELPGQPMDGSHSLRDVRERGGMKLVFGRTKMRTMLE